MRTPIAAFLLLAGAASLSLAGAGPGRPGATAVEIATAQGGTLGFVPTTATVPEGPIVLTFRNVSTLEHNLTFTGGLGIETRTIVPPGDQEELRISSLPPGSYEFVCTIHHEFAGVMSGVLVVSP